MAWARPGSGWVRPGLAELAELVGLAAPAGLDYLDMRGYEWILMEWISVDIRRYQWILVDISGHK